MANHIMTTCCQEMNESRIHWITLTHEEREELQALLADIHSNWELIHDADCEYYFTRLQIAPLTADVIRSIFLKLVTAQNMGSGETER